jgi:hypothetical protein
MAGIAFSQSAENGSIFPKRDDPDQPKSVKEMLYKMQSEKEQKDHEEMLDRGEQVSKESAEMKRAFDAGRELAGTRDRLDDMERLVKKIRAELGGGDDDRTSADDDADKFVLPTNHAEGIKALAAESEKLSDELKKTTRFTISAAAIESTNSVLKLIRFLRGSN